MSLGGGSPKRDHQGGKHIRVRRTSGRPVRVARQSRAQHARRSIGALVAVTLAGVVCVLGGAVKASADPLFSDGFESGNFSAWTSVVTAAGGSAAVQSTTVKSGTYAAQLSETTASGSKSYARKTLGSTQQDLTVSGDFDLVQEGASGGNVPFIRLFDSGGTRIVSLFRQNAASNKVYVGYGGANVLTSGQLALNTWGTLQLHVVSAGAASTVEVSLNGTLVYQTTSANLGSGGILTVQIGNETSAQAFTLVADNIAVQGTGTTSQAPANTSLPTISGTAQQGQALSASPGSWSGTTPISFTYQWQRCDAAGANCVAIAGQTSTSYTAQAADVGSRLVVLVTASNSAGSANASSAASAIVQAPSAQAPANTSLPTISGTAQQGQALSASPGSWSGTTPISFTYQWQRCDAAGANCVAIAGQTSTSYTAQAADVGSRLVVLVTASNSAGSANASSAASAIVQAPSAQAPANTSLPTISGTAQQGQALSASPGSWSGTTPISFTYQWQRCDAAGANCVAIAGQTSTSYTAQAADVGSRLVVLVTASNSAGSANASSAASAIVQAPSAQAPANTSLPTISGTAQQGQALSASPGSWSGTTPISFTYQWQRCDAAGANCVAIAGQTSTSYTAQAADVGSRLVVLVTASNSAGSANASSAASAIVQAGSGGSSLFSDGFESGNFSAWTSVVTAAGGSAAVQSTTVKSGTYAAQLSETTASGSKSYARKTLGSTQQDLTVSGDFDLLQEGASGGNVPFIRLFDSGGTRIVSLFRQNAASNKVYVGYGGANVLTSGKLALSTWGTLQLHVVSAGAGASTVQVWVNSILVYQTTSANLGTAGIRTIQIGNDSSAQAFTLVADNIAVQGTGTTSQAPANTSLPTISGTAQQGQALSASPGSWSGTTPISFTYQWQRCDAAGANCVAIAGQTSTSYTAQAADVGSRLVVLVTASNSAGSANASTAPSAVVQSGAAVVVALWHMDELTGNMLDSISDNDGTLHSVTMGQPGFTGSAYGFNGSSSYVAVPSADVLNPGSANISFTIHVKTTGTAPPPPADWDLFRKGLYETIGGEYKMEFQQSGQASCGFEGTGGYSEIIAGPALNDGQWHTITCVKTSVDIELVVDGQTFAQPATIGTIANTEDVVIGGRPGSDWYGGQLDEASISIG